MKTRNEGTGIVGWPIDPATGERLELQEHEHFHVCLACGQSVDRRDFGQVIHHEQPDHKPLQADA